MTTATVTQTASPAWLVVGWIALAAGFLSTAAIAWDVAIRGYRQHMAIMNWVYPITGLYWGPVAVYFYFRRGRQMSHRWAREHGMDMEQMMSSGGKEDPPGPRSRQTHCRSSPSSWACSATWPSTTSCSGNPRSRSPAPPISS